MVATQTLITDIIRLGSWQNFSGQVQSLRKYGGKGDL